MKPIRISTLVLAMAVWLGAQSRDVVQNFVVKDKKGQAAKTLTADQLEFSDDGLKPAVTLKLFDGADEITGADRKAAEPMRRVRLIPIVFEGLNNEQRRLARQIASDLIKEDKDPAHLFAVFKFSNQLCLLQPFTENREEVRKAIEVANSGAGNLRFAEIHRGMKAQLEAKGDAMARLQLGMLSEAIIDDAESTRRSLVFLDAMIAGLKTVPGRKAVAYLNAGLQLPTNLDVPFEAMLARANTAGVSLYPIDTRGITTVSQGAAVVDSITANAAPVSPGLENREQGDNTNRIEKVVEGLRGNVQTKLITMAQATGGVMAVESNDPKRQLRELISDLQTYYEITYNPDIVDFNGAYRKTMLAVKNSDYKVRARDGYLAMPPGLENLLPYELPLMKSLSANPMPRDVQFFSGAWRLKAANDAIQGMVAVEVPFANLAFAQDEAKGLYAARISVLTQVRDPQGKVIEKFTRDLPLKGKLEQLEALKNSNFNFRERFTVPPGRYIIESAVVDQLSHKTGARKTSFVASAPASALSISNVAVVRSYQPGVKDLTPTEAFQFQGGRITPTLNTTLKAVKGAQMALFFIVYAEPGAPPQAVVQYLKDGDLVGNATLQLPAADDQGRIPYVLSSPLEAMPPGSYEVKIIVKQGAASVAESVFLTIGT